MAADAGRSVDGEERRGLRNERLKRLTDQGTKSRVLETARGEAEGKPRDGEQEKGDSCQSEEFGERHWARGSRHTAYGRRGDLQLGELTGRREAGDRRQETGGRRQLSGRRLRRKTRGERKTKAILTKVISTF